MKKNNIKVKIDDKELLTPEHDKLCLWVNSNFELMIIDALGLSLQEGQEIVEKSLEWEIPIKNNGYVIGIPDFKYTLTIRTVENSKESKYFWNFCGFIECKPDILSIGDTMRQMKLYKSYYFSPMGTKYRDKSNWEFKFNNCSPHETQMDFILVTHGKKYKELFENQSIPYYVVDKKLVN